MGAKVDLTGRTFGRLLVIGDTKIRNKDKRIMWLCKCECGNETNVEPRSLINGATKSCGCLWPERSKKHGASGTKLYSTWVGMLNRCRCKTSNNYEFYGAKGISVCKEWVDFLGFQKSAIENGYEKGLSIDRKNPSGNYEPGNCRWATRKQQDRNKRNTKFVLINGEKTTISDVAEKYGLNYCMLSHRYDVGIRDEKILSPCRRGIKL